MKFADQLSLVETLSYYDRPLLEHWKQIDRITLSTTGCPESHEGDMFDGTIEHWVDNYFSNFTVEGAMAFAEEQGVQIVYDLVEGDELSPSDIPAELLPGEGSYLDHYVFVAWQMAQEKLP